MLVSKLVENISEIKIIGNDIDIENLAYNTNNIEKNSMFFCIKGYKTDGHIYASKAVENGAVALVVSEDIDISKDITIVKVKDTRDAMAVIASSFYNNPSGKMNIFGITGTNGKTTSTFMLKSIMDTFDKKTALLGTIYNIIGDNIQEAKRTTPESLDLQKMFGDMVKSDIDTCIMEVSSHSLALKRTMGVNFKVGIFTNLTQDHLDFHDTMENYFIAKMLLFSNCQNAVINIDDEYGKRAAGFLKNNVITYGIENKADVYAENIQISGEGTSFLLRYKNEAAEIMLHLPGKFNVYNALSCAGAAIAAGVPLYVIKSGLEALLKVPGRSEKINSKKGFTIVIDYAHTPDGIINILKTAREYTKGRLITVFGCGGDRDKTKRPKMGHAAGSLSDFCIITSDNPRTEEPSDIIKDIIPGVADTGCSYIVIENRKSAIKHAIDNGKAGDVIVIAGKGHETYQILKDTTIHFDEREIVSEFLKDIE